MRICFINPSVGTIAGGSETIIYQFAKDLSNRHEVTIIAGKSRHKSLQKNLINGPYEVITVPFWPRFTPLNNFISRLSHRLDPYKTESLSLYWSIKLRPKVKKRIKEMDVISTHYRLDSLLFSDMGYKLGVPSVFNIQMGPYGKNFFEKDKSSIYIANSHFSKKYIEENDKVRIHGVVTPGIPSEIFAKKSLKLAEFGDEQVILFVGRLEPNKGVMELLDIYKELTKQKPKLRLVFVGEGSLKNVLIEKSKNFGLKNVIFTGSIEYDKVFSYYNSATILVHPSHNETFGITILEAMACGLPVVATEVPGISETSGGCAVLLPLKYKKAWIDKIIELLEDPVARKKMSETGIERAKEFTWDKKAKEYEEFLIQAASNKPQKT